MPAARKIRQDTVLDWIQLPAATLAFVALTIVLGYTVYGLVAALARLVLFTGAGLYSQPHILPLAAVLLPCALLGLYLGHRLHHRLPQHLAVQMVWTVLILGSLGLLWRGLFGR
ncbi:MAG: hypothetical protein ACREXI_11430 [Caldimonas sp.]